MLVFGLRWNEFGFNGKTIYKSPVVAYQRLNGMAKRKEKEEGTYVTASHSCHGTGPFCICMGDVSYAQHVRIKFSI